MNYDLFRWMSCMVAYVEYNGTQIYRKFPIYPSSIILSNSSKAEINWDRTDGLESRQRTTLQFTLPAILSMDNSHTDKISIKWTTFCYGLIPSPRSENHRLDKYLQFLHNTSSIHFFEVPSKSVIGKFDSNELFWKFT